MKKLMKKLAQLIQCLLIGVAVSSCTARFATLRLVGTKDIDSSFEKGSKVWGEDCGYSIVYVPVHVATVEKAIENALQKENGDLLLDVRVSKTFWGIPAVFPALYLNECYQVSGTVAKLNRKWIRHPLMKIKIARGSRPIKIASIAMCCLLASCFGSYNYGSIGAVATTRNVELSGEKGATVRGEACRSRIFVFPTGLITIRDAIEDALRKANGDLLRDAVIDWEDWGIPFVYQRECWIAEGTVLKRQQPKTVETTESEDTVNCFSG